MKNLILFLLFAILMVSCTPDVVPVENPKTVTTQELQDLQKDTVTISIQNGKLYVFNKENLVVFKTQQIDNAYVTVLFGPFFIIILLLFFAIIIIIGLLTSTD